MFWRVVLGLDVFVLCWRLTLGENLAQVNTRGTWAWITDGPAWRYPILVAWWIIPSSLIGWWRKHYAPTDKRETANSGRKIPMGLFRSGRAGTKPSTWG